MSDLRSVIDVRIRVCRFLMILSAAFLLLGLYFFQILHADKYIKLAWDNRLRLIRIPSSRGEIFDRNGSPLAVNITTFDILGYPLDLEKPGMIERLSLVFNKHGFPIDPENLSATIKRQFWTPYRVVRVITNLTLPQMADLVADPNFPTQCFPMAVWRRTYPAGSLVSNVLGYAGEISESELRQKTEGDYLGGDRIGKGGIEAYYEQSLRGRAGEESIEVDARGRRMRSIDYRPPLRGRNIKLTLDLGAQRLAADLLKGLRGAVVVMDAHTGGILVLCTSPSYDNNPLSWGISAKEWSALTDDPLHPMMDRSIAGVYPPGSTFKAMVAFAALEEKEVTTATSFFCAGEFQLGTRTFKCWKHWGHGTVRLVTALQDSCDVYFYQVGLRLGINRLVEWGRRFGLGARTGIDIPGEAEGNIAGIEWKKERFREPWYKGDTVNYSIGQGFLLMTPLQIARMYAFFANGGRLVTPYLVESSRVPPIPIAHSPVNLDAVRRGLQDVVRQGTGWRAGTYGVTVAGKTGTSQNAHGNDHALFAGYAPADRPRYVAVAVIEAGEHGSSVASPIVGQVLSYLLVRDFPGDVVP
jgi:penicillin-binding protein 2